MLARERIESRGFMASQADWMDSHLFGVSYPVMGGRLLQNVVPTVVFVSHSHDCYLPYALEGGP
jgi:hypothetical protein